jgi:murein DD-endopeptidase MepM/ murein hydrolase activator NlpD
MLSKRVGAACCAALLFSWVGSSTTNAEHSGEAAKQAAAEIQAAQDRANAAAQAAFDEESRLDGLQLELRATEQRVAELETEVGVLHGDMQEAAVRRFVGSGVNPMPLFTDVAAINDQATADVLVAAALGGAVTDTDDFEAALEELEEQREVLDGQRAQAEQSQQRFEALMGQAEAEVLRLTEMENERLVDAEVQHELERQRRERAEREAAEAAARAAEETARAAEEAERAAQQAPGPATQDGSDGREAGDSNEVVVPPPPPPPPPPPATSGMICPVNGPTAYADTWGAPRSGGRSHQGVDMMSPQGTPLVAVESGSAQMKTNALGGNVVWLSGASGAKYYYAHLSAWEGGSRGVSQGEVIGYVGATGNTSANHLHFEVHPGGGGAVNPYPFVRAVC